jgi:hypothetical protein
MQFDNPVILNKAKIVSIIFLFTAFAFYYLSIPLWDYDFWWHIANGRYMVTSASLPEQDPFCFTSLLEENKNPFPEWENFILKQYWLSQIIFYFIYDYSGITGIIILRSLLLIVLLIIVFWRLQIWHVSFPIAYLFTFAVFIASLKCTGERPVLFTIVFTALIFFLLEDYREQKKKRILLLIPLMLLWSNLHGGFIIGIAFIIAFMFGEGINFYLKKSTYSRKEILLFYGASVFAIGASFINPTGWDSFYISMNIPFKYKIIHEDIKEYISPFVSYKSKLAPLPYEYILMVFIFPFILLLKRGKIVISHLMVLFICLVSSISASRFMIYYVIIGAMILGREFDFLINSVLTRRLSAIGYQKIMAALTSLALISSVTFFVSNIHGHKGFQFKVANNYSVPVGAVDFIEKNNLSGNMFNDYAYGGYISWRLYPYKKTFIDTRTLNISVRMEYGWIVNTLGTGDINRNASEMPSNPLWKMLFSHYDINYVVLSVVNPIYQIYPIIFELTESNDWVPVYSDQMSVIYVKNTVRNSDIIFESQIPKGDVYNTIIYQSAQNALMNKTNPRSLISLGDIFHKMQRLEDALKAYRYALTRIPDDPDIQKKIVGLESEINLKKSETEKKNTTSN